MFRSAFALVALVGYASAQLNQRGVSENCTSAVAGIITNHDAANCLGAASLPTLAKAVAVSSSSLIPPLQNWISDFCSSPKCNNKTLADVLDNIIQNCASDLNLNDSAIATLTSNIEQYYPTLREILCLNEGSAYCIIQFLTNIQATVGSITVSKLADLVQNIISSNFPPNIICTNCNKAMYLRLNESISSSSLAKELDSPLKSQCGAAFFSGPTPTGIIESANTSSSASSTAFGSVSFLSHGIITGLIIISALLLA